MKPSLILHPVSYSISGRSALALAITLARWYQADLHVLELRGGRARDPIVRDLTSAGVEPHFAELVESAGSYGARIRAVEIAGDDVPAVIGYAEQASADVVVVASTLGSHGPDRRSPTYAQDLAQHLPCQTLVVPAMHDARLDENPPFARILCATDSTSASATAVERATSLAQETGATLTLLHVHEGVRAVRRAKQTNVFESEIDTIVERGIVGESIVETALRLGSDLIVIGRTENGAIDGTAASGAVLETASCPVLVIPPAHADRVLGADTMTAPDAVALSR